MLVVLVHRPLLVQVGQTHNLHLLLLLVEGAVAAILLVLAQGLMVALEAAVKLSQALQETRHLDPHLKVTMEAPVPQLRLIMAVVVVVVLVPLEAQEQVPQVETAAQESLTTFLVHR